MTKAKLYIAPGKPTVEEVVALYRNLTGKEPTEDELNALKRRAETALKVPIDASEVEAIARQTVPEATEHAICPDADPVNADWPKRTRDVTLSGLAMEEQQQTRAKDA